MTLVIIAALAGFSCIVGGLYALDRSFGLFGNYVNRSDVESYIYSTPMGSVQINERRNTVVWFRDGKGERAWKEGPSGQAELRDPPVLDQLIVVGDDGQRTTFQLPRGGAAGVHRRIRDHNQIGQLVDSEVASILAEQYADPLRAQVLAALRGETSGASQPARE